MGGKGKQETGTASHSCTINCNAAQSRTHNDYNDYNDYYYGYYYYCNHLLFTSFAMDNMVISSPNKENVYSCKTVRLVITG